MFDQDACCYGVNGDGETYARLAADIDERILKERLIQNQMSCALNITKAASESVYLPI